MNALDERIRKTMVGTIAEYDLLEEGDRVLVAVSGGKDSTIMLLQLEQIRRRAPFSFELEPVLLDQKQPGFEAKRYSDWLAARGFELTVLEQDTYSVVVARTEPGKSYCGLCSRLRRGALYSHAAGEGFTKIALGHHREDLNETLLLNLFFSGVLGSMPARLESDDGRNVVIRPMAEVAESDLTRHAEELAIPVIPCNLCGNQENARRQEMKALVEDLEKRYPGLRGSMLTAQKNLRPTQLMDREWTGRQETGFGEAPVSPCRRCSGNRSEGRPASASGSARDTCPRPRRPPRPRRIATGRRGRARRGSP